MLFAPEEVLLFKEGPSVRRAFLDRVAEMLAPAHMEAMARYERVVAQRNRLLKEMGAAASTEVRLAPWNQELIQWGCQLFEGRQRAVTALNEYLPIAYRRMAAMDPPATLAYLPHCGTAVLAAGEGALKEWFAQTLAAREVDEMQRQYTLVGPHRDDLAAHIGGRNIHDFGSQGQHRSLVLAMKVAEGELYRQRVNETPIFLLDDVTSELDPVRTGAFFRYLAEMEGQAIWTTTDPTAIPTSSIHRRFTVEDGNISS